MTKRFLVIASVFMWVGCIVAISFMEAWLKFRAPGVTLPIGLGIGKLVFAALNKIEWIFAAVISINLWLIKEGIGNKILSWFVLPFGILLLQTIWLLPALEVRAISVIEGRPLPPSPMHGYFAIAEVLKVITLTIFGWQLFKQFRLPAKV